MFCKKGTPDRSKIEKSENMHIPKNAKNLISFFDFQNYVNDLYKIQYTFVQI